jgi:hypothetical protein
MNWFRIVREGSVCSALVDRFLLSDSTESHCIKIVLGLSILSVQDGAFKLFSSHVPLLFSKFWNCLQKRLIDSKMSL